MSQWAPSPVLQLATDALLQAKAEVKKLEKELRLEKDVHMSTTLLALGLVDKVRKQDNVLEALMCHSAKLGRPKTPLSCSVFTETQNNYSESNNLEQREGQRGCTTRDFQEV